jgi:uncharacterized DUF497 family protein
MVNYVAWEWNPLMRRAKFEWDDAKDAANQLKHGVSFTLAQQVFLDPRRVIAKDLKHGQRETRFYCFGEIQEGILTVRFTWRQKVIRIIGAGFWREGKAIYERQNALHERTGR